MPRKHLFAIVVLLGAAAVAGLLAMTRTQALGSPAATAPGRDAAISFRLKKLDRLEAKLAKEIARQETAVASRPVTVYRRSPGSAAIGGSSGSYEEQEHADDSSWLEEEDRDD